MDFDVLSKMAFDMKLSESGIADEINYDEEYFLRLIEVHDLPCPQLDRIWEQFYEGPRIYPNHAEVIAKELDVINSFITSSKSPEIEPKKWGRTYKRLREFFAKSYELGEVVQCISD